MKLNTKFVTVTVIILAVFVAVFAYLNRDRTLSMREAQESGGFFIRAGGEEYTVTMEDVFDLSPFDIRANYKPSGIRGETRIYQGISFKTLLDSLAIDYTDCQTVVFNAADGYASALRLLKALDEDNCYIVISHDNNPLGTLESGGTGPFMMILAHDRFSQYWCKYLLEVSLR